MNEQEQLDQLVQYIRQHLDQGIAEADIRHVLLQHNWHAELVDRAFLAAKTPQQSGPANPDPASPQKYKVFRSIGDTFRAITQNPSAFTLAVVCSYIIAIVSFLLVTFVISKVLFGETGLMFASTAKILTILFSSLILYTLWFAFAGALVLAAPALALPKGREDHKLAIGAILSQSFKRMGHVVAADILFCLVALWPIVLTISTPFILGIITPAGSSTVVLFTPILLLIALIWSYVALFRFALAPYVALFEPNVPIFKTLGRSKHLLVKGGQWFMVKGFLLVLLILIALSVITGLKLPELMDSPSLGVNIFIIALTVLINSVLVMLYHNRKVVRG